MLTPQDVGWRVVVRRVVGIRDGRPLLTDILGELLSYGPDELVVSAKNGRVSVPLDAIVAGKRIPPRRTASAPDDLPGP